MPQDGRQRGPSLVFPLVLIIVGALFLYAEWRPAFDPWPVLSTYWPLILIFVGLGKMWDYTRRQRNPDGPRGFSAGATLGVVAFALVLIAMFWHVRAFSHDRGFSESLRHEVHTVDLQGAKSINADLTIGAGMLDLRGGSSHLLDASFEYFPREGAPEIEYNVSGGAGQLSISQTNEGPHIGGSHNNWNLHFANDVPINLKISMGAGESDLHLRDLNISELTVQVGAGRASVDLTGDRKCDLTADLEGGVGEADVRLPRNVGVIVNASGGIGSIDARGLKQDGDEYTNAAYDKGGATIHLTIHGGVGRISLVEE